MIPKRKRLFSRFTPEQNSGQAGIARPPPRRTRPTVRSLPQNKNTVTRTVFLFWLGLCILVQTSIWEELENEDLKEWYKVEQDIRDINMLLGKDDPNDDLN